MSVKRLAAGFAATLAGGAFAAAAFAQDGLLGQPTPGGMGLQPGVSPLRNSAIFFHDWILMPVIVAICLLVLGLMAWIVIRYNAKRNPVPARWSHNTPIEVLWTVVPVLILMVISVFSFQLLFRYHDMPTPGLTVKATGYQWYWGYEYPDQGVAELTSTMLSEEAVAERRLPHSLYRFAVDQPMVVPVNTNVRVLVTGADVIHAFAVPAFGIITDAVPGRVNETWFRATREGTFYGNCRELCGVDHAFMPIEVQVLSRPAWEAWVRGRGGNPAGVPQPSAAAAAATPGPTTPPSTSAAPTAPTQGQPSGQPSGTAQEATAPLAGGGTPVAAAPATTSPATTPTTPAPADTPAPGTPSTARPTPQPTPR